MASKTGRKFNADDYVFVRGRVVADDDYVFVAHDHALLEKERYRCIVLRRTAGTWTYLARFDWQAVDMAILGGAAVRAFVLGRDGQVGVVEDSGTAKANIAEERVDAKKTIGPLRGIDAFDSSVFAYGMKREIFRRSAAGKWSPFDTGMRTPIPTNGKVDVSALIKQGIKDMGGIDALVAPADAPMHAFGMRGEIWLLEADKWKKVDSPTNLMLADATTVNDDIYVCGQAGTLLKGKGHRWDVVVYTPAENHDFSDIEHFDGGIYLADGHSLRVLKKGTLELVNLDPKHVVPSSTLEQAAGRLLSVAGQEIFVTADGTQWTDLLH